MHGELFITGLCPHCSLKLDYKPGEQAVFCSGCCTTLPTSALTILTKEQEATDTISESAKAITESINSSESALIYFDSFVEKYDWASFAECSAINIPMLDSIAEAALIKFPSDYLTYILDFKRRALPLLKKIEALDVLLVELAHKSRGGDSTEIYEVFNIYSAITVKICEVRESVRRELVNDIRLSEKFGAGDDELADLARSLEYFDDVSGKINAITDINDVAEFKKIKLMKDAEHIAELRRSGIDPEKTYEKAIGLLDSGDINNALRLLIAVSPYNDSEEIIKRHTSVYRFGNGLYEMAGKLYVAKLETVRSRKGRMRKSGYYALYELQDGKPCIDPAITGVSEILAAFGSRIFFIRENRSVCCFDAASTELYANVRVIDEGNSSDYVTDGKFNVILSRDRNAFYIRKKINVNVKKCLFKRKPTYNRNNNYSLIKISMDSVDSRITLPLIVDVMDYFEDSIFYTTIPEGMFRPVFRMYNLRTGMNKTLLGPDCVINDVKGGKIIFTEWAPNQYNMNLYTLDPVTNEKTLIAKNIREFNSTFKNKMFYTVGGENYSRLYSANLDGSEVTEIMADACRVLSIHAGWIYYKSGEGRNACLKKISLDGKNKVVIADRYDYTIKFSNGYIYYSGRGESLCIAKCDGGGANTIATDIHSENVLVDDKCIYYLKEDMMLGDRQVYSLYSSSLDGKNLKKLIYDVSAFKEHSKGELYVRISEEKEFMISIPESKKESRTEYTTAMVHDYCVYDKEKDELTLIASVGAPDETYVPVRSGFLFFKRTKYLPTSVIALSKSAPRYKREGVAESGAVLREAEEIIRMKKDAKKAKKQAKKDNKKAKKEAKKAKKAEKKAAKAAKKAEKQAKKNGYSEDAPMSESKD